MFKPITDIKKDLENSLADLNQHIEISEPEFKDELTRARNNVERAIEYITESMTMLGIFDGKK